MDERPAPRIHRRIMAYVALLGLCSMGCGAYLREIQAPNADVLIAVAYVLGAVVLGYLGAQVVPDVFKRRP